ncbi:MAG: HD domain-containing protein [Candidatus Binatia bacterium]
MHLTQRFSEALAFADHRHRDHLRKGTQIPYISHLLSVAGIVLEFGGTEEQAIAALLHDAVEDGKATAVEIDRVFGAAVRETVLGCSDTDEDPKPPWRQRKERYIAHLNEASSSVLLVSAADKLHNARAILADYREVGDRLWERFNKDADTLWYYRALADAFRQTKAPVALIDELERVVTELESLTSKSK